MINMILDLRFMCPQFGVPFSFAHSNTIFHLTMGIKFYINVFSMIRIFRIYMKLQYLGHRMQMSSGQRSNIKKIG